LIKLFIKVKENIIIALNALRDNKMRAVLTTVGIIIGVLTVVSVASIIEGLNKGFANQISSLGSNTLYIQKYPWMSNEDWFKFKNRPNLKMSDFEYVQKHLKVNADIIPNTDTRKSIKYKDNELTRIRVTGAVRLTERVDALAIEEGRFFTDGEISRGEISRKKQNAVIGWSIKDKLFDKIDPIGQRILIGGIAYNIIGVLEKRGSLFGFNMDDIVYIPITALFKNYKRGSLFGFNMDDIVYIPITALFKNYGSHRSVSIMARIEKAEDIEKAKDELRFLMRMSRGIRPSEEDNFSINQQAILLDTYNKLTGGLYTAAIGIGALALLVGGIGIMNIMLVSVAERKREIGIRKALGATKGMISFQFIIESIIICSIGGIIAIGLSFLLSIIIDKVTPFPSSVPLWSVILGLSFSSLVGLFFGIYPARQAAKLNPIDCLHYE